MKLIYILSAFLILVMAHSHESQAQQQFKNGSIITVEPGGEQTIYRQAGNYSQEHDVITIAVLRGTAYRTEYDQYFGILGSKLDSLGVPHVIFQQFINDKPGTIFHYFLGNQANGHFDAHVLLSLLPHISRRYRVQYPHLVK